MCDKLYLLSLHKRRFSQIKVAPIKNDWSLITRDLADPYRRENSEKSWKKIECLAARDKIICAKKNTKNISQQKNETSQEIRADLYANHYPDLKFRCLKRDEPYINTICIIYHKHMT